MKYKEMTVWSAAENAKTKAIVFCDSCDVVLCDVENEKLYNDWQDIPTSRLYFFKFEEFYEKHKGNKREVEVCEEP